MRRILRLSERLVPRAVLSALVALAPFALPRPVGAGPIFEPGARVIVTAVVDRSCNTGGGNLSGCPNQVIPGAIAAAGEVAWTEPAAGAASAAAGADLAEGLLRARAFAETTPGAVVLETFARAEAAFFDILGILPPPGGGAATDMLGLSIVIDGNLRNVSGRIPGIRFGFTLRDANRPRVDPENPDAPVSYLVAYERELRPDSMSGRFETLFDDDEARFDLFDPLTTSGDVRFGLQGTIALAALGPAPRLELSAWLLAFAEATSLVDFGNTARLRIDLPEGYALQPQAGFLLRVPSPPAPVPAPAAAGLFGLSLIALAGFARLRRC